MLADAFRAELAKFAANRAQVFWGAAAVPMIVAGINATGALFLWGTLPAARTMAQGPLSADAAAALSAAGNPVLQIFYVTAAAILLAGEYRWETWRYVVPRSSRAALILAKFGVFAALAALSLLLLLAVGVGGAVLSAALNGAKILAPPDSGAAWAGVAAGFAVSLAQLCAIGGIVALVSVATRSLMGAVLIALLFGLGQFIFTAMFGEVRTDPRFIAALPNRAGDTARRWAAWIGGDPDAATRWGPLGLCALLAWTGATLAVAIAWFRRQDLSQE